MKLIDVSKYNGNIDYAKVKADGYEGVIIRAVSTNSGGLYKDAYFETNYKNAKANGLYCGAYFYTYALDYGYLNKELALFKTCLDGKTFELPIIIDVEDGSQKKLGRDKLAEMVKYALDTMQGWGAYAMWYSYKSFIDNYINAEMLKAYDFWFAWYTSVQPKNYTYGIWQHSSQGVVNGINGRCDINIAYKDYPSIIKGRFNDFTNKEATIDKTDAIQFLSTEPVKMTIGKASESEITTLVTLLSSLKIGCEANDGFIYTDVVSVGDQKTIIAECNLLGVEYKQTVGITFVATETETPDDVPTVDYNDEQKTVLRFIKWLMKLFKISEV